MSKLDEFLAGERLDDVALYLTHEYLDSQGKIPNMGEEVENGYVLVVPGDNGRRAFAAGTGMDAMEFAQTAMGTDGDIDGDLSGGVCPDTATDENHEPKFIFSFAEAQNEEVGGLYEEGDVIHAYAKCECGTAYSDRWVVDDA
ncbi:hypothetical protein C453_18445 [Haloferax elongans ATCC BAA-1513]|uniref:Uncharacterized protein n=1 Tax=Haloferax elongans ATCC BAA-1513 TaxID=1230453 RepID=M0HCZ5_HALEO|nr:MULTISPECIES: DUF5807 family protein [Haloferax]ELZ80339.1 hypothetical protein C455_05696 [Haloferax larsenii JCM 13917]ELZ80944.1 hypothetical protein C453_18445 [Haloferax elongans ATCC BAA-1513]